MTVISTTRLNLRELRPEDADFYFALVRDPDWIRFIGDRGYAQVEQAREALVTQTIPGYTKQGFGLWLTETKLDRTPMGICGLVKREGLDDIDLGFAFLPAARGQGYAHEAAAACLAYGFNTLGQSRIVAITDPENHPSKRLLLKLGFVFEKIVCLKPGESLELYGFRVLP